MSDEPERPSWVRVTLCSLVALLASGFAVMLLAAGLSSIGLMPPDAWDATEAPWKVTGTWAAVANAGWTAFICAMMAWLVSWTVEGWTEGWAVRFSPVVLAIVLGRASGDAEAGLVWLALVVVVVRNVALVPARETPAPTRRKIVASLVAAIAVAIATLSYQPLHPLSVAFEGRRSEASFSVGGDPSRRAFSFVLGNDGVAALTVRSIEVESTRSRTIAVQTRRDGIHTAASLTAFHRPLADERLARGEQLEGRLLLVASACRRGSASVVATVLGVEVRFETLGRAQTRHFRISPPARLRCP